MDGVWQEAVTACAMYHRLRRICQKKKNGTCLVPPEIQEQYKAGGASREALMEKLQELDCDKDDEAECNMFLMCVDIKHVVDQP